jgi:hypothetical protein
VIGTIAILRPASSGFKRLVNIVVAAVFNIVIFGAGASIYLFAVDIIMNTASLPGWLQITLVWLCGIVGGLLLRPYRRITQLGGKSAIGEIANVGSWHKKFFTDLRGVATAAAGAAVLGDVAGQGNTEEKEKKGRRRRAETSDPARPATGQNAAPGDDGPGREPAGEHVPAGTQSAPDASSDRPARRAGDDRVWVPDTGRYADGSDDRYDLADEVGRTEAQLSSGVVRAAERDRQSA